MRTKRARWHIAQVGQSEWALEQEHTRQLTITDAHCTACALTDAIGKYGGDVDLRGLSNYGHCFTMLASLVRSERKGARV